MKLSYDRVNTLVKQIHLPYDSYITTSGDKIYQTNYITITVTCYTIKREKLWGFKDDSVLKGPCGVTVDNSYNCLRDVTQTQPCRSARTRW